MPTARPPRAGPKLLMLLGVLVLLYGIMWATGAWTAKLGLDLRGGTSITLTARPTSGQGAVTKADMEQAVAIIRNRVEGTGVAEADITIQGSNHIVVAVPGINQDQIVSLVGQTAELRFRQVIAVAAAGAPAPGPAPTGKATPSPGATATPQPEATPTPGATTAPAPATSAKPTATSTPKSPGSPKRPSSAGLPAVPGVRAGAAAAAAPAVRPAGFLRAAAPSPSPAPTASPAASPKPTANSGPAAGATAGATVKDGIQTSPATGAQTAELAAFTCAQYSAAKDIPTKPLLTCDRQDATKFLLGPALVLGKELKTAAAVLPQNQLSWQVNLTLKGAGPAKFANATRVMYQLQQPLNAFAIVLDGKVISYPTVQQPIPGGTAQITGSFSQKDAADLANVLKYGALPLAFDASQVETVSPTLGSDQLRGGMIAGAIGLAAVVLYCFFYYRGLGIVVVSSLAIAALITYAAVCLLGVSQGLSLTLAGIAGLIVAIGITADSFIVYFERLRDEVRDGRGLRSAVEAGWLRARRTIVIADSVSFLAALVLYVLSVGSVKNFAYTLGLTTIVDVFVVFFFTKPMLTVLARTRFFGEGHRFSGFDADHLGIPAGRLNRPPAVRRAAAGRGR